VWNPPKYLLVESAVLPEIFVKVAYAKHLLESGAAANISNAAKTAGISRSAIYKYRDSVFAYERKLTGKIASLYLVLRDKPGILSKVIGTLYENGSNVLTINQNIPVDGVAAVSISASVGSACSDMELLDALKKLDGVVEVRRLTAQ
jgi:chorismate mutase